MPGGRPNQGMHQIHSFTLPDFMNIESRLISFSDDIGLLFFYLLIPMPNTMKIPLMFAEAEIKVRMLWKAHYGLTSSVFGLGWAVISFMASAKISSLMPESISTPLI